MPATAASTSSSRRENSGAWWEKGWERTSMMVATPCCSSTAATSAQPDRPSPGRELVPLHGPLDGRPQCPQLAVHGVELGRVHFQLVHHGPVEVDEPQEGGGAPRAPPHEQGV